MWSDIHLNKIVLFILYTFANFHASAQSIHSLDNRKSDTQIIDYTIIEADENYIILFKFDTLMYEEKCPCSLLNSKSKKCRLIKGSVIDVLHSVAEPSHFMSRSEIFQTIYILVPDEKFSFTKGQMVLISAYSPISKKYLIYNQTRNKDENKNYIFKGNFIQSPGKCYKYSLLRWIRFTKKQPTEKDIKLDKFVKFIDNKK